MNVKLSKRVSQRTIASNQISQLTSDMATKYQELYELHKQLAILIMPYEIELAGSQKTIANNVRKVSERLDTFKIQLTDLEEIKEYTQNFNDADELLKKETARLEKFRGMGLKGNKQLNLQEKKHVIASHNLDDCSKILRDSLEETNENHRAEFRGYLMTLTKEISGFFKGAGGAWEQFEAIWKTKKMSR